MENSSRYKFRAWDKTRKRMVGELQVWDWCENRIIAENGECKLTPIENFEIMQLTGLKDKNGKEIFEKDIVKITINQLFDDIEKIGIIEWSDFGAYYEITFPNDGVTISDIKNQTENFEVIGDIYSNPELLEEA